MALTPHHKNFQTTPPPPTVQPETCPSLLKGLWERKFDRTSTQKGVDFKGLKSTVKVEMMNLKSKFKIFNDKNLKSKILHLPFKTENAEMLIFLPDSENDFEHLDKKFNEFNFTQLDTQRSLLSVRVSLPKFNLTSTLDLKAALKKIGVKKIFKANQADFSKLSKVRFNTKIIILMIMISFQNHVGLHASDVMQKAFIEVNEEGAEAAAVSTVVVMNRMAAREQKFICNRPFLFVIRDIKNGLNLFIGKVVDPS